jgi:amino acid adenylation domain-containing protein
VGYFTNTVPIRARVADGEPFTDVLQRTQRTVLGAIDHQDIPFALLVERFCPRTNRGRLPLAQVGFFYDVVAGQAAETVTACALGRPGIRWQSGPLALESLPSTTRHVQFDLALRIAAHGGSLLAALEYAEHFDETRVRRFAAHFVSLLESVVAQPQLPVGQLALLAADERRRIVDDWNATARPISPSTIHDCILAHARRSPDAIAVALNSDTITYAELERRSGAVLSALLDLGIGEGELVAVVADRTPDTVAGALGVMRAGAAYVPIDPAYPDARVRFMLEDSAARAILVDAASEELVRRLVPSGATVLRLDVLTAHSQPPAPATEPRVSLDAIAYAIYTSGSTGQPKAVLVPHRCASNLFADESVRLSSDDVFANTSSLSFDLSVHEIWGALVAGAKVVIVPKPVLMSARELDALLRREAVTVTFVISPLFALLARETPAIFAGLRRVFVGGDVVDPAAVRAILAAGPPEHLLELYGPTEATVLVTLNHITTLASDATYVALGRPIANAQTYILNESLEPVPVGVAGELCIGGAGVAAGYWRRPELTAERFLTPAWMEPSRRLYRTGDLARFHDDGSIEFLGRIDQQVKVRGYRIELGEIESAAREHPGVLEAVVTATATGASERRIVAHVVARDEGAVDAGSLRAFLRERLPEYMIPSAIAVLEDLPLTPNGKIDRTALSARPAETSAAREHFAPPRDETEAKLCAIWSEVIGVEQVGIDDDFFDLGGDSLQLAQAAARMSTALGREIRSCSSSSTRRSRKPPKHSARGAPISRARRRAPPSCPAPGKTRRGSRFSTHRFSPPSSRASSSPSMQPRSRTCLPGSHATPRRDACSRSFTAGSPSWVESTRFLSDESGCSCSRSRRTSCTTTSNASSI